MKGYIYLGHILFLWAQKKQGFCCFFFLCWYRAGYRGWIIIKTHLYNIRCSQIDEDSLIILNGTLHITSNDSLVFEDVLRRDKGEKVHLIPCSDKLKNYVVSAYDDFVYLKSFDERFWISVHGKYMDKDTLLRPRSFLFNFVALIDETEALNGSTTLCVTPIRWFYLLDSCFPINKNSFGQKSIRSL